MKKLLKKITMLSLSFIMAISLFPQMTIHVSAAVSTGDLTFVDKSLSAVYSISDGGIAAWNAEGNEITATATGYTNTTPFSSITTLTFKNNKSQSAVLVFDYTLSGGGSLRADKGTLSASSYQYTVPSGGEVTLTLTSPSGSGTCELIISNLGLVIDQEVSSSFLNVVNGSYSIDGKSIVSDSKITVKARVGYLAKVTSVDTGYKFVGWYSVTDGYYLSTNTVTSLRFDTAKTIQPVFVSEDTPVFQVEEYFFTDLADAIAHASSYSKDTITLISDGSISGDYVIPSGVTLLIPHDDAHTLYRAEPGIVANDAYTTPKAFRTLSMKTGSSITVSERAAISVSAKITSGGGSANRAGSPTGNVGFIEMEKDSEIIVAQNGSLYVWGFIIGDGQVSAKRGSTIYECMQISDFRGGNATLNIINEKSYGVFPFSQYYVQNIEVLEVIEAGASVIARTAVTISGMMLSSDVKYIGGNGSDAMFVMQDGAVVTKEYLPDKDTLSMHAYGNVVLNGIEIDFAGTHVSSKDFVLPITNNLDITVDSGDISIGQNIALLPGAEVTICDGASLTILEGYNAYIYDQDVWKAAYVHVSALGFREVAYSKTKSYTRTSADMTDATINVNGSLIVEGQMFTTAGGANIISSAGSGCVEIASAPDSSVKNTYQIIQNADNTVTYQEIAVTPTKLNNGSSFTETSGSNVGSIYYYSGSDKKWETAFDAQIHFDANTGSGSMSSQIVAKNELSSSVLSTNTFTKEGYTFAGWNTSADGNGQEVSPDELVRNLSFDENHQLTLYAQWDVHHYTISFDGNNGIGSMPNVEVAYDETIELPNNAFERTGYEFTGWKAVIDGTTVEFDCTFGNPSVTKLTSVDGEVITLSAQWKKIKYSINYDLNGGNLPSGAQNIVAYDIETSTFSLVNPVKAGYDFAGWTWEGQDEPVFEVTIEKGSVGNRSYTANWAEETYAYTIIYRSTSGIVLGTETIVKPYQTVYTVVPEEFEGYITPDSQNVVWDTKEKPPITFTYQLVNYEISFDMNGGQASLVDYPSKYTIESENILLGSEYNPLRTGYTFTGWTGTDLDTLSDMISIRKGSTGNRMYQANWSAATNVKYTVRYWIPSIDDPDDYGTVPYKTNVYRNGISDSEITATLISIPGYLAPEEKTVIIEPDGTTVVDYYYTRNRYQVVLNAGPGVVSTTGGTDYLYGEQVTVSAEIDAGYEFTGWSGTYTSKDVVYTFTMPASNVSLTANASVVDYELSYDLDGGLWQSGYDNPKTYNIETETFVLNAPVKTGYEFVGWTWSGQNEPVVEVTIEKGSTGNRDYQAVWNVSTYTVTWYYDNGDVMTTYEDVAYGTSLIVPETVPETKLEQREGYAYDFVGWDATGDGVKDHLPETVTADLQFTAVFKEREIKTNTYTVTFYFDDMNGEREIVEYEAGDAIVVPDFEPSKTGYTFTGWSPELVEVMPAENLEYFANYEPIEYTVTFDANHGSSSNYSETAVYDKDYIYLDNRFVREGYTFAGWNTKADGTGAGYAEGEQVINLTAESTITLYAQWVKNQYTLTLYVDGEILTHQLYYGDVIDIVDPEKIGYDFAGWNDKIPSVMPAKNLEFTATWTIKMFTVNWDFDADGTVDKADIVEYGSKLAIPSDPIKEDTVEYSYEFTGWSESLDENTVVTDNMYITAQYVTHRRSYTIQWDLDGDGTVDTTTFVEYGNMPSAVNPEKEANEQYTYTFSAWSPELTEVTGNAVYTALYDRTPVLYTLTFKAEGADAIEPMRVGFGNEITVVDDPERTGYTFMGWDLLDESGTGDGVADEVYELMPAVSLTYEALWKINQYTITLKTGYDDVLYQVITQDYGTEIEAVDEPERTGYTFVKWTPGIPSVMGAENMTVEAEWNINQYTMTFDANGGDGSASISGDYASAVSLPENPVKTGYTFVGWDLLNSEGMGDGLKDNVPSMIPAENQRYQAIWSINPYTVTFTLDDGSTYDSVTQEYGTVIVLPDAPVKEGYSFAGWKMNDMALLPDYMPAYDVLVSPVWTINTYTIEFETLGGTSIDSITQEFGSAVTIPESPEKDGYTFVGWDKEIPSVMPAGNVVITAVWERNEYIVSFDTDGGNSIESMTLKYDAVIELPENPIKTGYKFLGWKLSDGSEVPLNMPSKNITLVAQWEIQQFTVFFQTNGGSLIESITVDYGTPLSLPEDPVKEGYVFGGWNTELPLTMPAYNVTLSALWNPLTYEIYWDTNGDGEIDDTTVVEYGKVPFHVDGTKSETAEYTYQFAQWAPALASVTGSTVYTAQFTSTAKTYTITFDANGGTAIPSQNVKFGSSITVPENPSREGYTFNGWDKEIPEVMPAENLVFVAQWTPIIYTINFYDGVSIQPYASIQQGYETVLTVPSSPSRTGYTFKGWDLLDETLTGDGSANIIPSQMPSENQNYLAIWSVNEYTITFDTDGGNVIEPVKLKYNESIPVPDNPIKEGYTFLGWNPSLPRSMPAQNLSVTAQWEYIYTGWKAETDGLTYLFNGKVVYMNTWATIEDAEYYFNESGYVVTGVQNVVSPDGSHMGMFLFDTVTGKLQNEWAGVYETSEGSYYVKGGEIIKDAGLVRVVQKDGEVNYYFISESGHPVKNTSLALSSSQTNGLLPEDTYQFDEEGVIPHDVDTSKNGVLDENGQLIYYIDGIGAYFGVFKEGDYYYYAGPNGVLYVNVTSARLIRKTNGLVVAGYYNFDAKGRMYGGTIAKPSEQSDVKRIMGATRYETSLAIADALKEQLKIDKFETVILASGNGFADALAGSYLAAVKDAPIIMVDIKKNNMSVIKAYLDENMNPNGQVYILGGTAAVPSFAEAGLTGYEVKRLAGSTRYETNLIILKEAKVTNEPILVCYGRNFADSLSASATGLPLLLVEGSLNESQKTFLKAYSGNQIYVLGGTAAVSSSIEAELRTYGTVIRIAGKTRYETSVAIAKEFFPSASNAVLAYAQNYPDGLCGGPLAYNMKAPMILTSTSGASIASTYTTTSGITGGAVLGGSKLISDNAAESILGSKPVLKQ